MAHPFLPVTSVASGLWQNVAPNLDCHCIQIVNIAFISQAEGQAGWFLVDTGMPKSADDILAAAEAKFGGQPPAAILLTHGHFDHVGAVAELAERWRVPVFAHELEFPYLTGQTDYPEGDSTVEGGLVAKLSPVFPNKAIDIRKHLQKLPADGSIPGLHGWRWLHTPGHSPGHVSFFREEDRALIAGDAFITVRQDSLFKVMAQIEEVSGPPRYFTTDWEAAGESVRKLAALRPTAAVTGHGPPLSGETLSAGLTTLARDFDQVAVPDYGRYVETSHT
ncbi:MBL fold metallo-hydrolase [Brevibacillus brevis]|uniref:MBL fold metallo-hydrolase n=1 Tax=Brevibacillus brevis TaxID=1393 RepID=A0ABY9TCE8_BREBE|nr:MBL fold metallo-hydrolase [Brevibacillus brevis]WNC16602.1 MBL fold metallo-hydrolase [Brevibacillus brevis]